MQSTGAAYMGTGGAMLMRDVYVRYLRPYAGHGNRPGWAVFLRRFTAPAVALVLALGIVAVLVTFVPFFGLLYPLNLHSAGWGGIVGFGTAIVVTPADQETGAAAPP